MSETMQINLSGKTAFVTGGGRGLGAALCAELAAAGAGVMVADIDEGSAQRMAHALRDRGCDAQHCALDVGNERQVADALTRTALHYGGLDILINNAGVDHTLPVDELQIAQWDQVITTNLRGPFLLCKRAVDYMKPRGTGHIVNVASTAAKRAWANASAYHASKWGLLGLSHALHAELRPQKIKVTAVVAGGMRTPFLLDRFPGIDLNCLQEPANVAKAIIAVLCLPDDTVVPEITVLPMGETSWP